MIPHPVSDRTAAWYHLGAAAIAVFMIWYHVIAAKRHAEAIRD